MKRFFANLFTGSGVSKRRNAVAAPARRVRLGLECLEERQLLSGSPLLTASPLLTTARSTSTSAAVATQASSTVQNYLTHSPASYDTLATGLPKATNNGDLAEPAWMVIQNKAQELASQGRSLGNPLGAARPTADGKGYYQDFQKGSIYIGPSTKAHDVRGAIRDKWLQMGGVSKVGYPDTDDTPTAVGGGEFNHFRLDAANKAPAYTSIYYAASIPGGAHAVGGAIRAKYAHLGFEKSLLGLPTGDEQDTPGHDGRLNYFQNGAVVWSAATGAHELHGSTLTKWLSKYAVVGLPTSDVLDSAVEGMPGGTETFFQNGGIYSSPRGTFYMGTPILDRYRTYSSPGYLGMNDFGFPTSDQVPNGAGQFVVFANDAVILWSAATGAHEVHGPVLDQYNGMSGSGGKLGYPTTETTTPDGARNANDLVTTFQHGQIEWLASGPATFLTAQDQGDGTVKFGWNTRQSYTGFLAGFWATGQAHQVDEIHSGGFGGSETKRVAPGQTYHFDVDGVIEWAGWFHSGTYSGSSETMQYTYQGPAPAPGPTPPTPQPGPADIGFAPYIDNQGQNWGGLIVNPVFPKADQPFTVTWTDANFGGTATGKFTDKLVITDLDSGMVVQSQDVDVASLAPGALGAQHEFSFTLPAGHYVIQVLLNAGGTVQESNYGNNTSSDEIVIDADSGSVGQNSVPLQLKPAALPVHALPSDPWHYSDRSFAPAAAKVSPSLLPAAATVRTSTQPTRLTF
jgi:uncharacterized protein with LGFP repeats